MPDTPPETPPVDPPFDPYKIDDMAPIWTENLLGPIQQNDGEGDYLGWASIPIGDHGITLVAVIIAAAIDRQTKAIVEAIDRQAHPPLG